MTEILVTINIILLFHQVSCGDFTYGTYEAVEDYTQAIVNITYIDPVSGNETSNYDDSGRFFSGFKTTTGVLVHVTTNQQQDSNGCSRVNTESIPNEPWIALIQSGVCRDKDRLKNLAIALERVNASGALLYNNKYRFGKKVQSKLKVHLTIFYYFLLFLSFKFFLSLLGPIVLSLI